jgi:hypothetical protein
MLIHLVLLCFAVMMVNSFPKKSMVGGGDASPRELFSGRKIVFTRDLRLGFGDARG